MAYVRIHKGEPGYSATARTYRDTETGAIVSRRTAQNLTVLQRQRREARPQPGRRRKGPWLRRGPFASLAEMGTWLPNTDQDAQAIVYGTKHELSPHFDENGNLITRPVFDNLSTIMRARVLHRRISDFILHRYMDPEVERIRDNLTKFDRIIAYYYQVWVGAKGLRKETREKYVFT